MKTRCTNENQSCAKDYVLRGIKICNRWFNSFENFFADMGPRPRGHSIERINNNGNYEPGNCRWATTKEQSNNSRNNLVIEHAGKRQTAAQWAVDLGIDPQLIYTRRCRGETKSDRLLYIGNLRYKPQ